MSLYIYMDIPLKPIEEIYLIQSVLWSNLKL